MQTMLAMNSPIGPLYLIDTEGALSHLLFRGDKRTDEVPEGETPVLLKARKELEEYFSGARRDFTVPLAPAGTPFQLRCWEALQEIPYGETRSYKDIAQAMESPKAMRAVGMANNRNPIAIIVPCHRVIGANGKLVGYGGGLENKQLLLDLERQNAVKPKE